MNVHGVTKLCDIPDPIEGKKNHMTSLLSVDGACKFLKANWYSTIQITYTAPNWKEHVNIYQFSCMIKESEWTTWHSVGQLMYSVD